MSETEPIETGEETARTEESRPQDDFESQSDSGLPLPEYIRQTNETEIISSLVKAQENAGSDEREEYIKRVAAAAVEQGCFAVEKDSDLDERLRGCADFLDHSLWRERYQADEEIDDKSERMTQWLQDVDIHFALQIAHRLMSLEEAESAARQWYAEHAEELDDSGGAFGFDESIAATEIGPSHVNTPETSTTLDGATVKPKPQTPTKTYESVTKPNFTKTREAAMASLKPQPKMTEQHTAKQSS